MPRTKTTAAAPKVTRYKPMLEASLEREQNWKRLIGEMETRTAELEDLVACANANTDQALNVGEQLREHNAIFHRQVQHMRGAYQALAQRFVGVKLESQGFNLAQGNQWFANETGTIEQALAQVAVQVSMEFHSQAEDRAARTVSVRTVATGGAG